MASEDALCDVWSKFIRFCNKISGTGLILSNEDFEQIQNVIITSKKSKMNIIFLLIYKEAFFEYCRDDN